MNYYLYEIEKRNLMYKLLDTCKTSVEYQKKYEREVKKLINKLKI